MSTYEGDQAHETFSTYRFEQDIIVHREYRDGDTPPGWGRLKRLQEALSLLPEGSVAGQATRRTVQEYAEVPYALDCRFIASRKPFSMKKRSGKAVPHRGKALQNLSETSPTGKRPIPPSGDSTWPNLPETVSS